MPYKGFRHSKKSRKKISKSTKGKKSHMYGKHLSEETKRKISKAKKGKPISKKTNTKTTHRINEFIKINLLQGGKKRTRKTRKKISKAMKGKNHPFYGRHHSEESKRKISKAKKGKHVGEKNPFFGKHHTKETRKRMSEVHKDQRPSEEMKQRISKTLKGRKSPMLGKRHSKQTIKKMKETRGGEKHPFFGTTRSDETKKKISKKNKGRHHTEEAKQKISKAGKGKRRSEEFRKRMREFRSNQVLPTEDTMPEKALQEALSERGIQFETHVKLTGRPDIFIKPNICIFVDGDFWHQNPREYKPNNNYVGKEKALDKWDEDYTISYKLRKQDYKVIRFWQSEIDLDVNDCVNRILKLIK